MSERPTGWETPKTDWSDEDPATEIDFNRIENNIKRIEDNNRTLDPAQVPTGNTAVLGRLLSWIANRINAIVGGANWWSSPATTLQSAKQHEDNQAAGVHGSTSNADASRLAHRDASARTRVATPSHDQDAANKGYVDAHINATSVHSATSAIQANRLVLRDPAGRARVAAPSHNDDIARKLEVDTVQGNLDAKMHATTGHKHTGTAGDGPVLDYVVTAGSATLSLNPDTTMGNNTGWVKRKETEIGVRGTLRISFQLYRSSETNTEGQIRRNGVAVGTLRTLSAGSGGYFTYNEDISGWEPGDLVQVWGRQITWTSASNSRVQNLNIYVDAAPIAQAIL